MKSTISAAIVAVSASLPAFAEGGGDAAKGEKEFRKCKACHMIQDAEGTAIVKGGKTGPNLYGVNGRPAGSVDGFKYSTSMSAAGAAGLNWNQDDFVVYVADPTPFLRAYLDDTSAKGKMTFKLKKEDAARDVWAYLVSVGPAPQ